MPRALISLLAITWVAGSALGAAAVHFGGWSMAAVVIATPLGTLGPLWFAIRHS